MKPLRGGLRSGGRNLQEASHIAETIDNLIEAHGERVLSLLWRILGDGEEARDAYQETWTSIWRASGRLIPSEDPWPFIRKAAVHKAIDALRSRRSGARLVTGHELDAHLKRGPGLGPSIDLSRLGSRERACLTLFFWEGCSVREIAEQLGVPEGTVKTWMFRGRQKLRNQIEGDPRS